MVTVTMKSLLEAGVHFGHQTRRWDPRMKKFIFTSRNGIHIVDLQKTVNCLKKAYEKVSKTVLDGKSILFVGTKKQAQSAIRKEAERCGMFYINERWLGGTLTNFSTIKKSIYHLKKLEKMEVDGSFSQMTKKEVSTAMKERDRLEKNLGGIKDMRELPGAIFVIDTRKEIIAIAEAIKMDIPVIAVVDTNCNPQGIQFPIPGNDDAIRSIQLFSSIISDAVLDADNKIGLEVLDKDENADTYETPAEVAEKLKEQDEGEESIVYSSEK